MRSLCVLCLLSLSVFAAAPPAKAPPEWLKLIDDLGDDEGDVRRAAQKNLIDLGEEVVPALRKAARTHSDVIVRRKAALTVTAVTPRLLR